MIPFDFDYYKPETINEAVNIYDGIVKQGKTPYYYGGGTEIISMSRVNNLRPDAVIDIKAIKELKQLEIKDGTLIIGAGVELNKITESGYFPLLGDTVKRIADHTNQCKITIGGNINGTIIYRESVMPLLLSDAEVDIADENGIYTEQLMNVFKEKINMKKNALIVRFKVDTKFLNAPHFHHKKTKIEKIDYPVITVTALKYQKKYRMAFSGLINYPIRSLMVEKIINDKGFNYNKDFERILNALPERLLSSVEAGEKFRIFALKELIGQAMEI